jgi:hypothetical protein
MEYLKEAIRRIYFVLVECGLAQAEVEAINGTLKYRFLMWLYGNPEPMFDMQWPE